MGETQTPFSQMRIATCQTDSKGKNQPAFGRILFAENRQLVFYSRDVNEKRLEDAHFDYRIWGQKERQPNTARGLGIFDFGRQDAAPRVFKCEDHKTLSEIDSVYVTLEPSTADPCSASWAQSDVARIEIDCF